MHTFEAGKGINKNKLNENFEELRTTANSNETALGTISSTALRKDGTNLTQDIINDFRKEYPISLTQEGDISLQDNSAYFLTLTGNGKIVLPTVPIDQLSHTITVVVAGGDYTLDLGTAAHLVQNPNYTFDSKQAYSVMYIYNKLDKKWYYCLTQ